MLKHALLDVSSAVHILGRPFSMPNEALLLLMLFVTFSAVLIWFRLFGERGLMAFTVLATVAANIEVLILVDAFGMEQTLGNILFAATFLITDILSETRGKKAAQQAVNMGIATSLTFIVISQSWLLYTPNGNDFAFPYIAGIFQTTPRLMLSSLVVYAVCQRFDVWLYHKIWDATRRKTGDSRGFLWLRNNGSTLISQLINSFAFNFAAFWGVYDLATLVSISLAGYVIFIFTSLLDTPFVYLARKWDKGE